jgi:putative nucleotidyltransferase with HDIG domain
MGLFGKVDRSRALRARRIGRLAPGPGGAFPDGGAGTRGTIFASTFFAAIPSLGAAGVVALSAVLSTAVIAVGHWTAVGGARGVLVLGAGSFVLALVLGLAAQAFAPQVLRSAGEAARAGGLVVATLALVRGADALNVPYLAPLPLAGAVAVIVYGPSFAFALGVPLALAAGLSRALDEATFVTDGVELGAALGLAYAVAVVLCRRLPSRGALLRAGFASGGVLAVSLITIRAILTSRGLYPVPAPEWTTRFWTVFPPPGSFDLVWALLNGALFGFVLFELLPLVESLTGALTDIRLLELADLNRPILKKMNLEAPGTFHHSQVVARLAEAAADSVGANGLLARVGAYYHDIGKMAKPAYFTENNRESGRKHGTLKPQLSALVIHAHVKDGIELARELGLPERIVAFIPEHHGTTACEYFYRQAAREAGERGETVDKEVFRYPGPRPQSKETAIVHMADSVEAVTRSLAEPTPARIQNVVNEVVMDKLLDHQLDESPLTLGDLTAVQESMARVLTGIYHGRVKYPQKLEATAWEQRLERLAKARRAEHAHGERGEKPAEKPVEKPGDAPAAPEAKPETPAGGYEPPMTW